MRSKYYFILISAAILTNGIGCERKSPQLLKKNEASQSSTAESSAANTQIVTGRDGTPMVLVPEGVFFMGTNNGKAEEGPRMRVFLEAFYIDRFEISNERFAKFVKEAGYVAYKDFSFSAGMEQHPAGGLNWHDAKAYCEWAGKRLPIEYEWEKAARGTDDRMWPWGNERKNFGDTLLNSPRIKLGVPEILSLPEYDAAAGQSPYGCLHMADNVWEWVDDWFGPYVLSSGHDPRFGEKLKVLRGGWIVGGENPSYSKTTDRKPLAPEKRENFAGARCAMDVKNGAQ